MNQHPVSRRRAAGKPIVLAVLLSVASPTFAGSRTVAEPAGAVTAAPGYPAVQFRYSFVPFDRSCSERAGIEIDPAWVDELSEKVEVFQEYWDREGPRLLETAIGLTGKPFQQREMIATMSLCSRSMSLPLLLGMRRFLESTRDEEPEPMSLFGALVLHELLHTYVVDHLDASALTDEKYPEEPGSVRSHVHLMSLMKAVYLELGREQELARIVARDSGLGPIYERAWEIVNDVEGHEPFVAEIRRANAEY